jgi:hypothetical protein
VCLAGVHITGALHHLSFLDEAKAQVGCSGRLPLLVRLLDASKGGQTYDNLVGLLWNVGLLDCNQQLLAAAGAPRHLAHPLPARCESAASELLQVPLLLTCVCVGGVVYATGGQRTRPPRRQDKQPPRRRSGRCQPARPVVACVTRRCRLRSNLGRLLRCELLTARWLAVMDRFARHDCPAHTS